MADKSLNKVQVIQSRDAIHIVLNTLRRVDPRLMDHGERVAYILYKMMAESQKYSMQEIMEICVLGIFHDIGAYKVDEIDRMAEFETDNVWEHSIYGYLFLKYLSPLQKQAKAILYHHYDYYKFEENKLSYMSDKDVALMIHLADRIDISMVGNDNDAFIEKIKKESGRKFDPVHVALFLESEEKYGIINNLYNGTYHEELAEILENLSLTEEHLTQCLRMLAYSIDFRSAYTVMHTIHTVAYSVEIAIKMGYDPNEVRKIYYGALLHDLGKIEIPLEILEYPGKLDAEAMKTMRTHVKITEDIMKGMIDDEICQISIRHHEKLDGSGYPYGLRGEALTGSQRIVAVADIISALMGKRSYKESYPKEKILKILMDMCYEGKLCPEVCHLVERYFDEITKNVEERGKPILQSYENIMYEFKLLHEKLRNT